MKRFLEYSLLFLMVTALQVFLFDNLNLSVYVNPLVYIAFIVLLPMQTPHVLVLLAGLLLGTAMDFAMGTAGLNVAATLPLAFLRPSILVATCGKDDVHDGGVPSPMRVGEKHFLRYAAVLALGHAALFFMLESMSLRYLPLTLLRIAASAVVTVVVIRLIAMLVTSKATSRI